MIAYVGIFMNSISFIHISDVFLGSEPDRDQVWGADRAEEIYDTFEKVIDVANDRKVDFLFISGNLFAHQPSEYELGRVDGLFARLNTASVVYAAGRYDCMSAGSLLAEYRFSPGVYIMGRPDMNEVSPDDVRYAERGAHATVAVDHIYFPGKDVSVYGVSYFAPKMTASALDGLEIEPDAGVSVLVASGGCRGYMPVDFTKLKKSGFAYAALGGQDRFSVRCPGKAAYPGSPEAVSPKSSGQHGCIFGTIESGVAEIEFIPLARRMYKTIDYPVTNYTGDVDAREDILHILEHEGRENIYTINIIRNDGCEKNFDISECLGGFRILAVNGENFQRIDYEDYIKANKNNSFGALLQELYSADLEHREGVKLAVDSMIDVSGIYMKGNRRMSADAFTDALRQVRVILGTEAERYEQDPEIISYEETRQRYEVSPDVLDELNSVWAEERGSELDIRTIRNRIEELPRQNRRRWVKTGVRAALIPLMLAGISAVFALPAIIHGAAGKVSGGMLGLAVFSLILVALLAYYAGYSFSRYFTRRRNGAAAPDTDEVEALQEELKALEEKRMELHTRRVKLQTQDGYKKSLHDSLGRQEKDLEEKRYRLKLLRIAVEVLGRY